MSRIRTELKRRMGRLGGEKGGIIMGKCERQPRSSSQEMAEFRRVLVEQARDVQGHKKDKYIGWYPNHRFRPNRREISGGGKK